MGTRAAATRGSPTGTVAGSAGAPPAGVIKRSLTIAGHRTSVSLEQGFWDGLRDIARRRGQSVAKLVAEIDRGRGAGNLSSAIRMFVLDQARASPRG